MPSISVRKLYQDNQAKLSLAWSAGTAGADNRISVEADKPVLALVGHLNFIHPNQVQVLGVAEVAYLDKMAAGEVKASRCLSCCAIIATPITCRCSRPKPKARF